MEKFLVIYDASTKVEMTREEVQNFLLQLQHHDVVEFKGEWLTKFFRVIARVRQNSGRLHDGTRVLRVGGVWKDALNPAVVLDPGYYPELASDKVLTDEEYDEKIKSLPPAV